MRWVLLVVLLAGCASDFDPPSLVRAPRVIAVIAEPPEAAPGEDVLLTALVAAPNGEAVTFEWSADLSPHALASGAGQVLGEGPDPLLLPQQQELALLQGGVTERAVDALLAQIGDAPPGTPEHAVRFVYESVGLPVLVRVVLRAEDGTVVQEGFKRVFLSPRGERTTNPPPPRFAVGERWLSARGSDPLTCVPETDVPEVTAGEVVTFAPEPDEDWLETYPALDLEGRVVERREDAYYAWFSTAGRFAFPVTRPPERAVEWTAPDDPGEHPIWLVVRDGHLGASACRASVRVVAR